MATGNDYWNDMPEPEPAAAPRGRGRHRAPWRLSRLLPRHRQGRHARTAVPA